MPAACSLGGKERLCAERLRGARRLASGASRPLPEFTPVSFDQAVGPRLPSHPHLRMLPTRGTDPKESRTPAQCVCFYWHHLPMRNKQTHQCPHVGFHTDRKKVLLKVRGPGRWGCLCWDGGESETQLLVWLRPLPGGCPREVRSLPRVTLRFSPAVSTTLVLYVLS